MLEDKCKWKNQLWPPKFKTDSELVFTFKYEVIILTVPSQLRTMLKMRA